MKKFLLSTLIGTTLMTTITGGSLAFAQGPEAEASKEQTVKVSYESIAEIATTEYMLVIPQTIDFKTNTDGVDLKINLLTADGKNVYSGGKTVTIGIDSENEFKLMSNDEELPYSLTYDAFTFNSDTHESEIVLNSNKPSINGVARIKTTGSIKVGKYADTLTYNIKVSGA